ncbi:MAG: hypothetical protein ABSG03_22935 [Bryobacteraceae bacterium]|jgi:hypothetical protein
MPEETCDGVWGSNSTKIWLGIAAGTAIGVGIALSRRQKKSRWDAARQVGQRLSDTSGELADAVGDILSHVKVIYEEGRKVAEDAGALWAHGRKLAGR